MKRTNQAHPNNNFVARLPRFFRSAIAVATAVCSIGLSSHAGASEVGYYPFSAAAQEMAQVFWLAETAHTCGWATAEETARFEAFAVRFLAAHLEGNYKRAFFALVSDSRYMNRVQRAAMENAVESCKMARWQNGWTNYLAAARENEDRY